MALRISTGLLVAGLLFAAGPLAQTLLQLRLAPRPGQTFSQELRLEWSRPHGDGERLQQVAITLQSRVAERPGPSGGVRLAVTGTRLWYRESGGKRSWPDYDSAATEQPPPAHLPYEGTAFTALLGQTVLVEFDPQGRPLRVDGWDKAFDWMLRSFDEPIDETERERWRADFPSYLLESVFNRIVVPLPPHPIPADGGWTARRPSELGAVQTRFTVTDQNESTVVLKIEGSLQGRGSSGPVSGQCVIDRQTGWPIELVTRLATRPDGGLTHTMRLERR